MFMRVHRIIDQGKKSLIFYQILSTNSLRKCMEISLENLYVDIGAKKVKNESTSTRSNFDFQWTKLLHQNYLKHIAFFATFFKG